LTGAAGVRRFELSKWYADAVTEQGDAMILYSAELRWRGPSIHYTSLLTRYSGCPATCRFSLRDQPLSEVREGAIEWSSPAWNAEARWRHPGSGIREVLFDSPAGSLEWECIAPRSSAEFRAAGADFRGWGYVEHLRLSLPPWRLPIRHLRWGRFVNSADALVWIDWSGPWSRRVVYHNGIPVSATSIGDREIVWSGGEAVLDLDPVAILREGTLGATALSVLPDLDRLFPARILKVRERKWLSRATLRRPGCPDSTGMAIHEVVEWP
jgi:hypothetical protein